MTTLAELNAREAQVKGQIQAVDLACKSAISRLMEELDQISDQKIAILGREIEEEDRVREMRRAA